MLAAAASLLFATIVNAALVSMVLFTKKKTLSNRLFAATIVSNILWTIGDALLLFSDNSSWRVIGAALFYAAPLFTAMFLLFFSISFPENKMPISKTRQVLVSLPAMLPALFLMLQPLYFIVNFEYQNSMYVPDVDPALFTLYASIFGAYFVTSYIVLYVKARRRKGTQKSQLGYVFFAAMISSSLASFTNLLMPLLGDGSFIWLGPLFTVIYVILVTLAIAKYRLFSVRFVVARTAAYVLTVALVTALYFGSIIAVSALVVSRQELSWTEITIYFFLSLLLAASFQWFLKIFTKLTQSIFYRDAYDVQEVLSRIGHVLESEIRLESLAQNVLNEFCTSVHIGSGQLVVLDEGKIIANVFYGKDSKKGIDSVSSLEHLNQRVIVADELDHGIRLDLLEKHDYRLSAMLHTQDENMGYLLLGDKLNGDIYSERDIKLIEIIARDISVSVQNAKSYEEIARFNETLQDRVKQATRELQKTNEKLKALDEAKDEFVSMASHQLRTPLTSVKGYLSMVLEGDAGSITPQQKQFLEQAYMSSQRMVYLIADLLNVSRLKTGTFVVEKKETSLPDIVEAEVSQLVETAKSRQISLKFEKPKDFPMLMLDETKTRQVIMNFVDNAIYYTPPGGSIDVVLTAKPHAVTVEVIDTGIGVPKPEQHHLFTKFYRAGNARKARPDGTGLGLYMAKKVITAQGGSIIFKTRDGHGSTFGFSFPRQDRL